jgi:NAD(P)-dependent dehydrogenase (short-subunit alcohol dehydrogenase family)
MAMPTLSVVGRTLASVDISGRVAVVTGAAVGIGREIARAVAAEGAVIASTAGLGFDQAGSPEYAAAKAGLIRFTTTVRVPGVRVNGIAPDWIHTPRAERELAAMTPAQRAEAPDWIPMADICDQVLRFVRDDSRSDQVVELRPGAPPQLLS